jgi:hypothetical protein
MLQNTNSKPAKQAAKTIVNQYVRENVASDAVTLVTNLLAAFKQEFKTVIATSSADPSHLARVIAAEFSPALVNQLINSSPDTDMDKAINYVVARIMRFLLGSPEYLSPLSEDLRDGIPVVLDMLRNPKWCGTVDKNTDEQIYCCRVGAEDLIREEKMKARCSFFKRRCGI